ncbi:hypothetical protein [Accumulibacter sp.]|jgi:hypothetical protein|uniref:hypothetical protein n=1 Tax=Accumulibacter sp. TaxID=2053492 RepID=UPI002CFDF06C|nr:hypothetical protein [Methylophilaceae bacterium]HSG22513.1 hypothetical protein [Azonexus sp.]
MKQTRLLLLMSALCMTFAGTSLAATTHTGHEHKNEQGTAAKTLQLNAGKKWETDAALRQAMSNIRQAMAGELHEIHENRLSARGYGKLAQKVEAEVGNIVANCKLGAQADEQLHIVIVELLGGTEHMAGKFKGGKRQNGAVQVIGALEKYAAYFDDPGFKPIEH